ncbi:hypothetical protein ASG97_04525 [Bacillus sp. Soil745]|nr:hypothetical protein ASG97_04525 [Bacillus sp. Soil745]
MRMFHDSKKNFTLEGKKIYTSMRGSLGSNVAVCEYKEQTASRNPIFQGAGNLIYRKLIIGTQLAGLLDS